jgi:enamine deaminase RidA (YjgF/YER057c/UK114 family)
VNPIHALSISHVHVSEFERQPVTWHEGSLGCATFANSVPGEEAANSSVIRLNMPMLGQPAGLLEVWRTVSTVTSGQMNAVRYSCNDDLLFGYVELSEDEFAGENVGSGGSSPLQKATKQAYEQIFTLLDTLNYPYLLRIWNYFPDINEDSHGLERYRQFNIGRQEGFSKSGRSVTDDIPAACALGTGGGNLTIYFIAGQNKPTRIENPRQISAYYYPREYGPRTPTFSRASLGQVGKQEVLFVSGTASIVGHRSMHIGDVKAQTQETLANIAAVVEEANRISSGPNYDMKNMSYKVYVRHPEDIDLIRHELQAILGPDVNAIYLHADICRHDLDVEIEALAGIPMETI